jgi:rubrerythrin
MDRLISARRLAENMLSESPIDMSRVSKDDADKEILRYSIIAELDAISVYEQMANMTGNEELKRVLLDVAAEEKVHMGEFQTLLLRLDEEQVKGLEDGKEEVEELTKK